MDVVVLSIAGLISLVLIVIGAIFFVRWRRRRYRVSLKALFALLSVASLVLFVVVRYAYPVFAHRWAVETVFHTGNSVLFSDDYFPGKTVQLSYRSTGANPWRGVHSVGIDDDRAAARVAPQLHNIPELEDVMFSAAVTDDGLAELCQVRQHPSLRSINFLGSQITEVGLSQLSNLDRVDTLLFNTCPIGEKELAQLKFVVGLKTLFLVEEGKFANPQRFGETGFASVGELDGLETLHLTGLMLSDSSARHLEQLSNLATLRIIRCQISADAVDSLRAALPKCKIDHRE